jgi:hypothetical protein
MAIHMQHPNLQTSTLPSSFSTCVTDACRDHSINEISYSINSPCTEFRAKSNPACMAAMQYPDLPLGYFCLLNPPRLHAYVQCSGKNYLFSFARVHRSMLTFWLKISWVHSSSTLIALSHWNLNDDHVRDEDVARQPLAGRKRACNPGW